MTTVPSPVHPVPQAALAQFLDDCPSYVVLRNEEDLFENLQSGGDIDLLVMDPALAELTLIRHLGPPVRITRHSYVTEYYYDWGNIDVLPGVEWRGARYLRTDAVVGGAQVSARGRAVPKVAHEALISWFASLLWGGFFKERYAPVIRHAAKVDGVAFKQALVEAAGTKWGLHLWQIAADGHPETSAQRVQRVRLAIWFRAWLKSPVPTIERALAFVLAESKLRFAPSVPWIAILARDGAEQSALVAEVADRLTACRYASVRIVERAVSGGWLVAYWTRLVHLRAKGYILLVDRTVSWLLPKPDLVFLLGSAPDDPANPERGLLRRPTDFVLDGNLPLPVLAEEIQRVIRAWMLERSAANVGGKQAPQTTGPARGAGGEAGASELVDPRQQFNVIGTR